MALILLRDLISTSADRFGSTNQATFLKIREVWPAVLENLSITGVVQPSRFSGETLQLKCGSLSQVAQLGLRKETIRRALNDRLPPGRQVGKIFFLKNNKNGGA